MRRLLVLIVPLFLACATHTAVQPGVVARMWHGRVPDARAEEYYAYLKSAGITRLEQIPGNLGAVELLLHRSDRRLLSDDGPGDERVDEGAEDERAVNDAKKDPLVHGVTLDRCVHPS